MVVVREIVPAGSGDGLELVVGETPSIISSRCKQRIKEYIIGIVHLIDAEHLLETAFIKGTVVSDQRKSLDKRLYLLPDERKDGCLIRIFRAKAVNLPAEPLVVFRLRMDQTVEPVHNLTVPYDDYAYTAYAARALIGRLEIYCRKIFHRP
jgi:hypothetical protein